MMMIAGLMNSVPVRMIYVDDKSEVLFKSLAHAARNTRITQDAIKKSLNPLLKRRFKHNDRDVIFRIVKGN